MEKAIRLLIADNHELFRHGMISLLEKYGGYKNVLEAKDGHEMLTLVEQHAPDVVLLDLNMPGLTGFQAMPILRQKHPEVKVLILTMHKEPSFVASLIKDGASGYLLKEASIKEVLNAINTVVTGKNYLTDIAIKALVETSRTQEPVAADHILFQLTEEEKQLIRLIVQQHTSDEIADILYLSKRTIDSHRSKLLKKIGVKNVAGLTAFAMKHNIC